MAVIDETMTTTALAQWYGSARLVAGEVGRLLDGCSWVGVPFAGGMCELARVGARTLAVNDLHRAVVNLAMVAGSPAWGPQLYRRLRRLPFHPDVLAEAQERCRLREAAGVSVPLLPPSARLEWAVDYFVSAWMGRGGEAGARREYEGQLSFRWDAGGGDSATRFRSATASLPAWRRVLSRCTFTAIDALEFLAKCKDQEGVGLYCDPPFPGPGDRYKHAFPEPRHRELAAALSRFSLARVVCRYYDHPLVRELYPEADWEWHRLAGRKRTNAEAPEVLVVNRKGGGR